MPRQEPRVGDPSLRPEEGSVVIVSTPEMDANAASLTSLGAFLWLGGNRPAVSAAEIQEALDVQFGVRDVKVVPHYPKDFFALFDYQHHRDKVTAAGRFRHNGLDIHFANWRLDAHSDVVRADYHVHLCIEGIPLSAWCDSVAAQVLGPNTFVHYFDIATLRREAASSFKLWAWSANPSAIPKVLQVTIAPRVATGAGGAPSSATGHGGIRRRAIIHLDLLEDYTPDAAGNIPRRPRTDPPFTWRYGVVDGESRVRDRQEPLPRRRDDEDRHRRDDDHDRDDRRGRDNDRPRSSWRDRLFRSRSRAPERRAEDERHGSRREERGGDRGRDDRRRTGGSSRDRSARGRSLPPSPRTTSSDIIELASSGSALGWLCGTARKITKVQPSLTMDEQLTPSKETADAQVALDEQLAPSKETTDAQVDLGTTQLQLTLHEVTPEAVDSTPECVLATPTPPRQGTEQQDFVLATPTP